MHPSVHPSIHPSGPFREDKVGKENKEEERENKEEERKKRGKEKYGKKRETETESFSVPLHAICVSAHYKN